MIVALSSTRGESARTRRGGNISAKTRESAMRGPRGAPERTATIGCEKKRGKTIGGRSTRPPERSAVSPAGGVRSRERGAGGGILPPRPGFRPIHFAAAIEAGKHVFFEKPVASDPWGVRQVIAAGKMAAEKKLAAVTGTQRRHQTNYNQAIEQIHAGAIGDVTHMSVYWNGDGIWWRPREPGMTDMEEQVHNWYHHIWLCGDQICEQHIHNLDIANWVMNGHPISAYGQGGRQVRDRMKQPGEIWDHFAIEYEY